MIITEYFKTRNDGVKLFRTYSDENRKILQNETGIIYSEAIDVEIAPYTYSETDEFIEEIIEETLDEPVELIAVYREIPENIASDETFAKGELGWWKGELYESLLNNLALTPGQFAAAWMKVKE